jgi:hypothetical protein
MPDDKRRRSLEQKMRQEILMRLLTSSSYPKKESESERGVSKIYGTERKRTDVLKAPNGM